jgi:uncharacterized protein (TIGR03083 family)
MSSRTETVANLRTVLTSFTSLVDGLTAEQWAAPSLCPEWTARGVVEHVALVESALLGWRPDDGTNPFEAMGRIQPELARLPEDALAERLRSVTAQRMAQLEAADDALWDAPSFTPVGPATYGRFMSIREFDIWVHERDIRVPLGLAGDDGGPAAEEALQEVALSLGYIVGKKVGLPDGMSVVFDLTGPVHRRLAATVDGRARVVDDVADPTVTVATDSLTFMLLACGRVDPELPVADGRIRWSGDDEWGARAARNLRFTM